jgi:myo-inositol catabolism protein IolH
VAAFKKALDDAGVKVAANLPLYRWSGPDEDERQAAVRYWKRAIEITVQLDCTVMNSEFNGRPEHASRSEAQFWRSMEELLPVFEREGVELRLEPHPDDFVEDGKVAIDMIRGINSALVSFLYCAPHTFHQGADTADDMAAIMEYAGPLLTQLHVADSFNHKGSSGLRYILNPPGTPARIHQHLDIGQGEVDWDRFFATLDGLHFGDSDRHIMTACVFAWEDKADQSGTFMRAEMQRYIDNYWSAK